MHARALAVLAVVAVVAAAAAAWLLARPMSGGGDGQGLLLPGLAARIEALDRLEVRGAGDTVLVALEKVDGQWRMPDRLGWPANQREISRALFRLAEAKRQEAKTADPGRHARLGVESVTEAGAKGAELRLSGGGEPLRLTIGNNHPSLGGSYVRVGDEAQAWRLDVDIAPARQPADWLDRRLLDLPLARIASVRIVPAKGRAFQLRRADDDRFTLDGQASAAMGDPDDGNATAAFPEQLALDDVAPDSGAPATQTAVFESVDGLRLTVAAWRGDGGTWARLEVELDEDRASRWLAAAEAGDGSAEAGAVASADDGTDAAGSARPAAEDRLRALRAQVAGWQARFAGKQFLLPAQKAANLMKTRDDYLAGSR